MLRSGALFSRAHSSGAKNSQSSEQGFVPSSHSHLLFKYFDFALPRPIGFLMHFSLSVISRFDAVFHVQLYLSSSSREMVTELSVTVPTSVRDAALLPLVLSELSKRSDCLSRKLLKSGRNRIDAVGPNVGIQVKDGNAWKDFANQMTSIMKEVEYARADVAELKRSSSEMSKLNAQYDHAMYFCQIVDTFVCHTFLIPLRFPSDLFDKLASGEDIELCEQVQALGAPTGVTVEILLEMRRFFNEEGSGCARPRITIANFDPHPSRPAGKDPF